MGDDLDDLLDEIESKMGKKARKQTPFDQGDGLKSTLISSKQKSGASGNRRKDMTDALDDIFDDGPQLDLNSGPSPALRTSSVTYVDSSCCFSSSPIDVRKPFVVCFQGR